MLYWPTPISVRVEQLPSHSAGEDGSADEDGSTVQEVFPNENIDLLEKPPWPNDIAHRLGDKPPLEEGVKS
jgi:hypothetical protein